MTTRKTLRRSLMTAAMLAVFSLGGVLGAAAETDIYKDVKRPNGHVRSMAAKRADIRACGAINGVSDRDFPKSDACMRAHGWVIARVVPDTTSSRRRWSRSSSVVANWPFGVTVSFGGGSNDASSDSGSASGYGFAADVAASLAATNAANAAAQDMVNAAAAATTQTEVQFNTIYSLGN
jgi:hypothetical protein